MRLYLSKLLHIAKQSVNENPHRFYARWSHRTPSKVLSAEEYETQQNKQTPQLEPEVIELSTDEISRRSKPVVQSVKDNTKILFDIEQLDKKTHKPDKRVKYTQDEVLATTFDAQGNYVYTKMKDNDAKVATLMLLVKSRKLRQRKDFVLLEGKRLIRDALLSKCTLKHLLFSRKNDLDYVKDLLPKKDLQLYKVAYRDLQMWSDLITCPGIMGIFTVPNLDERTTKKPIPLTIICDNIREPGNLGTILRSSAAVGCERIILTTGCVDVWEPKVLRSASGAHFRIPIHHNKSWRDIKALVKDGSSVFLADSSDGGPLVPYYGVDFRGLSVVLVVGGETMGLSDEAYEFAEKGVRLNVPLENGVDSLNSGTALGILVFEIKRQLINV